MPLSLSLSLSPRLWLYLRNVTFHKRSEWSSKKTHMTTTHHTNGLWCQLEEESTFSKCTRLMKSYTCNIIMWLHFGLWYAVISPLKISKQPKLLISFSILAQWSFISSMAMTNAGTMKAYGYAFCRNNTTHTNTWLYMHACGVRKQSAENCNYRNKQRAALCNYDSSASFSCHLIWFDTRLNDKIASQNTSTQQPNELRR